MLAVEFVLRGEGMPMGIECGSVATCGADGTAVARARRRCVWDGLMAVGEVEGLDSEDDGEHGDVLAFLAGTMRRPRRRGCRVAGRESTCRAAGVGVSDVSASDGDGEIERSSDGVLASKLEKSG